MRRALELATKGFPWAFPNPMVGAVIVSPDGSIIGEGYHRKCGGPHAEVNAVASVDNQNLLKSSTMYVTLEPCAHTGCTGPCARMIIDKKIPKVVVGCRDPFVKVNGKGIEMLLEAGVEVTTGVLEEECRQLNAVFFTAHTLHRPFVTLKWAQTTDGFLDSDRRHTGGAPLKISTKLTTALVHRLRAFSDGILVGSGTIIADDPILDTRLWSGKSPRPIIMDSRKRITESFKIMNREPLIVDKDISVAKLLDYLYNQGFISLLVEGGAETINRFIESGIWDLARVEVSNFSIGTNGRIHAPRIIENLPEKIVEIGGNTVKYYVKNPLIDVKNL